MTRPDPIRVLGVRVDPWPPSAIRDHLRTELQKTGSLIAVYSVNPEGVMLAQRNGSFASVLERGDVCLSDGVGVTVAARMRGLSAPRVPGADLTIDMSAAAAAVGRPVFLLGAAPGVAAIAADKLRSRIANLDIETYAPPFAPTHRFTTAEEDDIAAAIAKIRPGLVCVALGQPKQESWIDEHRAELEDAGVRVAMAVGGSLDFLAGTQRRAPAFMRRAGLEWVWRLAREPESRAGRQLKSLPAFARRALQEAARRR